MTALYADFFFYECEGCKVEMLASFKGPSPLDVQFVTKRQGPKSETTFRCGGCRLPEGETGSIG